MAKGIVKLPSAFLRTAPGERAEISDEVFHGMEVEIKGEERGWFWVETEYRYRGYLSREALRRCAWFVRAWEQPGKNQVLSAFCDVLEHPSFQSGILLTLPRGSRLLPEGKPENGWQQVLLADGRRGWARAGQLSPLPEGRLREEAFRRRVVQTAMSYLGAPYRWGGKSPLGIDCSGLCSMAYLMCGVAIFRDSALKEGFPVRKILPENAAPGDLLYFPGHIALYLGEGRYLHSTGRPGSDGVVLNSLDPAAPDYREDLAQSLCTAGSIFCAQTAARPAVSAPEKPEEEEF